MDLEEIVKLYEIEKWSLRMISEKFETDHHKIKKILENAGIKIKRRNSLKKFTEEHKGRISKTRKRLFDEGVIKPWQKGKKMSREFILKNMKSHLKYDVDMDWLNKFLDIEKLKYLNHSITRKRDSEGFTTETYKIFIEKFYYDIKFNDLYEKWLLTGDKWIKPSLDHIKAKKSGGGLFIDNLQFLSWLENRTKIDMMDDDWQKIKQNISYYF